jgi:hypothetical protein
MTDAQKVEALTELLGNVIHTLEMKQYDIDDATLSHQCEVEADAYHQKMSDILYGVPVEEVAH